ncbi:hypothetical protein ACLOJK_007500 [Asimina triloba]
MEVGAMVIDLRWIPWATRCCRLDEFGRDSAGNVGFQNPTNVADRMLKKWRRCLGLVRVLKDASELIDDSAVGMVSVAGFCRKQGLVAGHENAWQDRSTLGFFWGALAGVGSMDPAWTVGPDGFAFVGADRCQIWARCC